MAKTEHYYFQGKASWAKLVSPDIEYKNWNVKVHLTPDSYGQFMKLKEADEEKGMDGILNEVKKDEDGYFVMFRRPTERRYKDQLKMFTPPEITDKEGKPTPDLRIGNGSDVTCKVECYSYPKPFNKGRGRAIRLVSVRVDNLVPYQKSDYFEDQEKAVAGLEKQPPQLF